MSIVNSYNGEMSIYNANITNLKLKSSLLFSVYTNITIANITVDSISQYQDLVVRLFDIHTFSNLNINGSSFQNMGVQFIYSEISSFILDGVSVYNVSWSRSIIETSSSTAIVIKNFNASVSISIDMPAFITFANTVIKEISNSNFTEIQYYVIEFVQSNLTKFNNNYLNGINKGLHFLSGSNGVIANSTFANFVQNIKSGDVYKSQIISDGSALSK